MKKQKPKKLSLSPLVAGDLIDVVAPGSATDEAVIHKACEVLQSWGFRTRVPENLIKPQLFLSQTDEVRFQTLKNALFAADSKAVWCARGGYGAIRLLPMLNSLKKPKNKKLLIGLSDITSLQIFLSQKWNWPSLHAPLLDRLGLGSLSESNVQELKAVLEGSQIESDFKNLIPINRAAQKTKSIQGPVSGGNLMVSVSTLGTPNQIQGKGRLLFFEELSERGYRIDRCLQQLQQAGVFKNCKGLVFGEFIKCTEPDGKDLSLDTIKSFCEQLKVPAFLGLELGHGTLQRPLFLNTRAKISSMSIDQSQFRMLVYSPYEVLKPRK